MTSFKRFTGKVLQNKELRKHPTKKDYDLCLVELERACNLRNAEKKDTVKTNYRIRLSSKEVKAHKTSHPYGAKIIKTGL